MKKLVLITALMCGASTLVLAQSADSTGTTTSGSTVTGTSSTTTSLNGSSGMGTGAVTTTGPTGVNTGPGAAQTTGSTTGQTATMGTPTNPPTANLTGNAMGTTTTVAPVGQAATGNTPPLKGANSFTKKEAAHRLAANGYTHITGLTKDSQSVWRGTAMKNGQRISVALDYRGNITEGAAKGTGSTVTNNTAQ
jgi:hypothetical protein